MRREDENRPEPPPAESPGSPSGFCAFWGFGCEVSKPFPAGPRPDAFLPWRCWTCPALGKRLPAGEVGHPHPPFSGEARASVLDIRNNFFTGRVVKHRNRLPREAAESPSLENENALVKIKELGVELAKIRDEVALNTERRKKLQSEKEELERRFEEEGKQLRRRQQEELQALEQRLQEEYNTKRESLQEQHSLQLEQVKLQHQDQVEDITASHEAAMLQLENNHIVAITVLQDENDWKIQELNTAHKLEKAQLEESFERLRLSLQDQIDTLTFQNQSLKAKADRFEEALKKNTEEQLKIVRAPYLHLEEDLKSLKHVLEMKNHQIHQQEKMIMELEKQVEKNFKLEEKITMLQQQNEELRARIEQNTVITRQLSEENANLQEYVEKEVEEKKKLSRTNEELLWKLQEGDAVSPVKLPPASSTSFYRCSSGDSSPAKVRTLRR